jgi:hypothetical protein
LELELVASNNPSPFFYKTEFQLTAIHLSGFQWPGPGKARPPNPWEYELIVLNKDANMKKADVRIFQALSPPRVLQTDSFARFGSAMPSSQRQL